MNTIPNLIVMLTYQDQTVLHAADIFEQCKNSRAEYYGMKELPLPVDQMKKLYVAMKQCGKKTAMEVVAYTEEECLNGAQIAVECDCDILMGTIYSDTVNSFCKEHHLLYMPYVGQVEERPSILKGSIQDMVAEASQYLQNGVYGINLLGYRYIGDANMLNRTLISQVHAPVCIAGSIDSYQKLDEVKQSGAWAYTIGSAFFDHKFGDSFEEQINRVCNYMEDAVISSGGIRE